MAFDYQRIWTRVKAFDLEALTDREFYFVFGLAFTALAGIVFMAFHYIEPPPPKVIKISTGSETGAYYGYAKQYAKGLEKHGIKLEILTSQGSVQNLERLRDQNSGVSVALIQSGSAGDEPEEGLESLASVAYEPVWVFYQGKKTLTQLTELAGMRVAIGTQGSGVHLVADALLKAADVTSKNATLEEVGPAQALPLLREGKLDAAFVVAAFAAPIVQDALKAGLSIMNLEHANAYARHFPWLQKVILPKGAANLAKNEPANDITLLANTTNLVIRSDLHPSLAFLLMDVATTVHGKSGLFHGLKEFPSIKSLDFPQSEESKRFLTSGRPFLQRYLPFWLANVIERLSVSLVPMLLILLPLMKAVPSYFHWREGANIARLYDAIKVFEHNVNAGHIPAAKISSELNDFEQRLEKLHLTSTQLVQYYDMKSHLDLLKGRFTAQTSGA
jgi:TRAP transporter TAXI family solute receptor